MKSSAVSARARLCLVALLLASVALFNPSRANASADNPNPRAATVRIPGEVLPALAKATIVASTSADATEPITLTLVLKRDNQPAFEQYLHDLYDAHSTNFHKFLTQGEIVDRFGPSRESYGEVVRYLHSNGFHLVEGSKNRLTVTVRGTRAQAERAFMTRMRDYKFGDRTFYANETDPALPPSIAVHTQTVVGLSNLAEIQRPRAAETLWLPGHYKDCYNNPNFFESKATCLQNYQNAATAYNAYCGQYWGIFGKILNALGSLAGATLCTNLPPSLSGVVSIPHTGAASSPAATVTGAGQKIGLLEFDSYNTSDVVNFLAATGAPATQIAQLSQVQVDGGAPVGSGEDEVLLDIDIVMTMAPGAQYVVYSAPNTGAGGSFQNVLNQMIDGGVTIISNSWTYCEDQTTLTDVQSIDSLFQQAAMSNISVFNGSGDTGSTCRDGSANTIGVPSDSPNATAVGGTSLTLLAAGTYGTETWWNGVDATPPTGSGGFGVSKFFPATGYQKLLSGISMRSVPDLAVSSDPGTNGFPICQADNGGCTSGLLYGGTSAAAPTMAALAALLNQSQDKELGFLNPSFYSLANTSAFHNAASMGTDFAHVGLGSPNLSTLNLDLANASPGAPTADQSMLTISSDNVAADGATTASVLAQLRDANGNSVSGKTISLAANSGTSAEILPASGNSTGDNGTVAFTVTDLITENVTLTATDTTDGVILAQKPAVTFSVPPAASAGLNAFPTSVTADGVTTTTITITMKDTLGRPTPGKVITLSQGSGNSAILGPSPSVTDSGGEIVFTATDQVAETVTYSAVDVTDGNLPFPQTGMVTFTNGPENGCGNGTPTAAPGFLVNTYVTGILAQNFGFSGVNFGGCSGVGGMAFDASGNLFISETSTGKIYKIPPGGGTAEAATTLSATPLGEALFALAFDSSGHLFAGRSATGDGFGSGEVVQLNPTTGAVIQTVASNLTCSSFLAIDPLSQDLFVDDSCSGGGSDNPALFRISNPSGVSPTLTTYANLPNTPNANISFAPNGTMYIWSAAGIAEVTGTNGPSTPVVTLLSGVSDGSLGVFAQGPDTGSGAQLLTLSTAAMGNMPSSVGQLDLTTNPLSAGVNLFTNSAAWDITLGPDGCIYTATGDAVFRITDTSGECTYAAANPAAALVLAPSSVTPNPEQGSSQNFTATFHNATVPAGTSVVFSVSGPNSRIASGNTNSSGQASFSYVGGRQGIDTITAAAKVGSTPVTSNPAVVTWGPGMDITSLTLNQSAKSASPNQTVTLAASLYDLSQNPPVPVVGLEITFTAAGQECGASTDSSGNATCQITPTTPGVSALTGTFAGTGELVASTASTTFDVVAPPPSVTPTATPTATRTATPTATPTPVPGKLKVSPKHINFGDVEVGSNKVKDVHVTNRGKVKKKKVPLPILIEMESDTSKQATNPFSVTQQCDDDDLGPRSKGMKPGTCEVGVKFAPTDATKYSGTLTIIDNLEPNFETSVKLEGTGKEPK